jgi:uncharacterized membrane protein YvlD (DUF360 family)
VRLLLGILGRYALVWLINVLALLLATSVLPGFRFDTSDPHWWTVALTLPITFAVLLILLRPLLLVLTLPLNTLTLGLPTLLINGVILYVAATLQSGFIIGNFLDALVGLVVLTVISTSVVGWLGIDEAYPFFQSVIYRLGRRYGPRRREGITKGLLILQIDGLSYRSLMRVLERGRMPTLSGLLARASHRLFRWRSGLPSNTPAVQAGLFYGRRADIPGYRWYDRAEGRVRVASNPADIWYLEARAATSGEPLLAEGTCISSFMSGGAAKRLVTVSAQHERGSDRRRGELADFNLFWLSPFAYSKAWLAAFWELGTSFFWGLVNRLRANRPRLRFNPRRLATRAVANALLTETAYFWIKQDLVRGAPIVYSNFVGYDEVAHHSGPLTYEAQVSLSAFDRKVRRLLRLMRHGAPIQYDLVLLSDHGQTPSVPFRHLYGRDLKDLVTELAGEVVSTLESSPLDAMHVSALLEDLRESQAGDLAWSAHRSRRTLERLSGAQRKPGSQAAAAPNVIVCVSGCLAHVYFEGNPRALSLEEIRGAYPGLVEGLATHPGIGFVAAREAEGGGVLIGGDGLRELESGQVRGDRDPLAGYDEADHWAGELSALLAYPSSGDLILNGAMLPDDRVVVFEEQLSSHGGLGGAQTEAFLLAPAAWGTGRRDLESPEALHAHILGVVRQLGRGKA